MPNHPLPPHPHHQIPFHTSMTQPASCMSCQKQPVRVQAQCTFIPLYTMGASHTRCSSPCFVHLLLISRMEFLISTPELPRVPWAAQLSTVSLPALTLLMVVWVVSNFLLLTALWGGPAFGHKCKYNYRGRVLGTELPRQRKRALQCH